MGVENFTATGAGARTAKRARVLLAAKLQTPYGEIDARLRDLSQKGALVECMPVPPQGTEVVFVRGPINVPARVAWAGEGRVGLEFHYHIDENEVLVQLKRVTNLNARERFRRPGIKEDASEKERALARAWGVQVGITVPDGKL
jgi:hypothetical protein